MRKEVLNLASNTWGLVAATVAVIFYVFDVYDQAIFLMCLAAYLKE